METLQRLSPAHAHNHLRAPAFHQLVQRCQQAYMQVTTWAVWSRVKHLGRQGEGPDPVLSGFSSLRPVHPPPPDSPDPRRLRRLCECHPQRSQRLLPDPHGYDAVQRHPAEPQAQQADQGAVAAGLTRDDHLLPLSLTPIGPYTGTQASGYGGPSPRGNESWLDRSSPLSSPVAQTGSCSWAVAWGQDASDPRNLGLGETALSGSGHWVASGLYLAFINI